MREAGRGRDGLERGSRGLLGRGMSGVALAGNTACDVHVVESEGWQGRQWGGDGKG